MLDNRTVLCPLVYLAIFAIIATSDQYSFWSDHPVHHTWRVVKCVHIVGFENDKTI